MFIVLFLLFSLNHQILLAFLFSSETRNKILIKPDCVIICTARDGAKRHESGLHPRVNIPSTYLVEVPFMSCNLVRYFRTSCIQDNLNMETFVL